MCPGCARRRKALGASPMSGSSARGTTPKACRDPSTSPSTGCGVGSRKSSAPASAPMAFAACAGAAWQSWSAGTSDRHRLQSETNHDDPAGEVRPKSDAKPLQWPSPCRSREAPTRYQHPARVLAQINPHRALHASPRTGLLTALWAARSWRPSSLPSDGARPRYQEAISTVDRRRTSSFLYSLGSTR